LFMNILHQVYLELPRFHRAHRDPQINPRKQSKNSKPTEKAKIKIESSLS